MVCPCHKVSQRQTRNRVSNSFSLLQLHRAMITLLVCLTGYTQDTSTTGAYYFSPWPQPISKSRVYTLTLASVCVPACCSSEGPVRRQGKSSMQASQQPLTSWPADTYLDMASRHFKVS